MILALPRRRILTPWSNPLAFLTAGKEQVGSDGKLRRRTDGKYAENTASSTTCCCTKICTDINCPACSDGNPKYLYATASGITFDASGICYNVSGVGQTEILNMPTSTLSASACLLRIPSICTWSAAEGLDAISIFPSDTVQFQSPCTASPVSDSGQKMDLLAQLNSGIWTMWGIFQGGANMCAFYATAASTANECFGVNITFSNTVVSGGTYPYPLFGHLPCIGCATGGTVVLTYNGGCCP